MHLPQDSQPFFFCQKSKYIFLVHLHPRLVEGVHADHVAGNRQALPEEVHQPTEGVVAEPVNRDHQVRRAAIHMGRRVPFVAFAAFGGCKQGFTMEIACGDWLPILCIEPLSAFLFSAVFLHEILFPLQVANALLIVGGALIGEGVFQKNRRR